MTLCETNVARFLPSMLRQDTKVLDPWCPHCTFRVWSLRLTTQLHGDPAIASTLAFSVCAASLCMSDENRAVILFVIACAVFETAWPVALSDFQCTAVFWASGSWLLLCQALMTDLHVLRAG